jgi:hypothetical protein
VRHRPPSAQLVDFVEGDSVQPGFKGSLATELLQVAKGAQDRLLDNILGFWFTPQPDTGKSIQRRQMRRDQVRKRVIPALQRSIDKHRFCRSSLNRWEPTKFSWHCLRKHESQAL